MTALGLFYWRAQACLVLSASFVLSALQNVTVDDAVLTGPVVPAYLPSPQNWAQGNNCSGCAAEPDASLAYNGTWHDTTFHTDSNVYQTIEFSFVGSGLYIFFILANDIGANVTTLTNLNFILDNVHVSSFTHATATGPTYEYNQAVFANNSIPYGQHSMTIMPVNDSVDGVLMLFDYLVYTTEEFTTTSTDSSGLATVLTLPSPPSSPTASVAATSSSSSGPNTGAIVGGVIGAVLVLVSLCAVMLYRRYKRHVDDQSRLLDVTAVEPFVLSQAAPPSFHFASPPIQQPPTESPQAEPTSSHSKHTIGTSSASPPPVSDSSTSTQPSPNALPNNDNTEVLEQVGMLRSEVARLRRLQDQGRNSSEIGSGPPPEYS